MQFLQEILEHAKQQPPEDTLVAVGGMHTTESITICIEEILAGDFPGLKEVPSGWTHWPVQGFFFEDSLANHWQPLLALGNIDNEPIALQVSFFDKLLKLRELMMNVYGSPLKYREVARAAKTRDQDAMEQHAEFQTHARAALRVAVGLLGHVFNCRE